MTKAGFHADVDMFEWFRLVRPDCGVHDCLLPNGDGARKHFISDVAAGHEREHAIQCGTKTHEKCRSFQSGSSNNLSRAANPAPIHGVAWTFSKDGPYEPIDSDRKPSK
jgi:hypothetical protein